MSFALKGAGVELADGTQIVLATGDVLIPASSGIYFDSGFENWILLNPDTARIEFACNTGTVIGIGEDRLVLGVPILKTNGDAIITQAGALGAAPLGTKHAWTAGQHSAQVAITSSGAALAIDLDEGNSFYHNLTEDTTLAAPSNVAAGYVWTLIVEANGTHELSYNAVYTFGTGTTPDFSAMTDGQWVALTFTARTATDIGVSYTETFGAA